MICNNCLCLNKFENSSDCPTGPREILNHGKFGRLVKVGDYKNIAKELNRYSNSNLSLIHI